jgi:AraC-like DNA-binding protein
MTAPGRLQLPEPFAFDYHVRTARGRQRRFVESWWYARGTIPYARERIAPTGSAVGVIVLGDAIVETPDDGHGPALRAEHGFLIGPHDRPVINEPTGETHAIGIVTTSIGCEAVFGVRPADIRGRVVDLVAAWAPSASLRERLLDPADPVVALDLVADVLVRTVRRTADPTIDRCARAVALLEADPTRAIADIAAELRVSHTRLDREFTRVVGLSPRVLARLLRMRRLLEAIDVRGAVPWADLAADYGWFDQSHLIRDFRRHTGVSPTDYLRAQVAVYDPSGPGDAAGFVPDPTPRILS